MSDLKLYPVYLTKESKRKLDSGEDKFTVGFSKAANYQVPLTRKAIEILERKKSKGMKFSYVKVTEAIAKHVKSGGCLCEESKKKLTKVGGEQLTPAQLATVQQLNKVLGY